MTIASCFIPGTQAVTVPRAISVAVPRVVPLLGRIATAYGVTDTYRRVTTFFNEQFKDKGKDSGSSKDRIQNTPQEVRSYVNGLQKTGCLGKWKSYGKYRASKFIKDCSYKGFKFKKGEFISRDRLHHEIEWFKDVDTHSGAIEPKGGTQYKGPDPTKKLRG
jgi:hypothetical protein